jgi:hypothetical protein
VKRGRGRAGWGPGCAFGAHAQVFNVAPGATVNVYGYLNFLNNKRYNLVT